MQDKFLFIGENEYSPNAPLITANIKYNNFFMLVRLTKREKILLFSPFKPLLSRCTHKGLIRQNPTAVTAQ
jgi:hypothetical protein